MKLPRYVDRQFWTSVLLTIAFYGTLVPSLVLVSWWAGPWAAIAFFAFLLWAYRWPLGVLLGLCARRPGALEVGAKPAAKLESEPRGA